MAKKKTSPTVQENSACDDVSCCRLESIVTVDERGQMVLPKELRARNHIQAGDRFAVSSWEKKGELCCITLTKLDDLTEMLKGKIGAVMKDVI